MSQGVYLHKPCSEETKKKMRESAHRGDNNSSRRPEVRKKISEKLKGRKNTWARSGWHHSIETRQKISVSLQGHIPHNKGIRGAYKVSEETKKKISMAQLGHIGYMTDKTHTNETKLKMSLSHRGKHTGNLSNFWIDGRSKKLSIADQIRDCDEYIEWRTKVFKRDNYTCQDCGQVSGYLEAHHIKQFNLIMTKFLMKYSQFSPIEDKETLVRLAMTYEPFWDITNGKTLCKNCHDTFKHKRTKEYVKI